MAVNLSPVGGVAAQFFSNNGVPLAGGKIFTYAAGTTTPQAAYTASQGNIAWTNPIVLDAAGRVPSSGEIWITDGLIYKFVLKDSNDVTLATYDNILGINSNFVNFVNDQEIQTATAGQTVFTLTTMQYQPGTGSLSVFVDGVNQYGPGAQYAFVETDSTTVTFVTGLHVGASVKFTTSAINASSYGDAFQISYTPPFTGSAATNVGDKLAQTVSVKDFGAVGDGVTDDQLAIARAIDSIAANGGVLEFENGKTYFVSQPIIIPYNANPNRYLRFEGNGAKLKGTLSTNIIETGQTTTSVGGVTNWNATPEAYLHGNVHISGLLFETYNVAIRFYNAVFNSSIVDNYFMAGKTAIQAKRSFYLTITQNTVRNGYAGKPDAETAVILEEFVNIIYFNDNHISGIAGVTPTGTGISISGGAYAFTLAECGIEGCKVGLTLSGENNPLDITGCYFEANEKSIVHTGGTLFGTASGNWLYDPITFESSGSPDFVFLRNTNYNNGTIASTVSTSTLKFLEDGKPISNTSITSNLARPAWQTVSQMAKQLSRGSSRISYNPSTGFDAIGGASTLLYEDQLMPFNYFGIPFSPNSPVPFCETSWDGAGNLTINTRIKYTTNYNGGIEFDLTVFSFSGTDYLAGRTINNDAITRFDASGLTVTMSNNGGYVRIVIGGVSTGATPGVFGRVRVT